MSGAGAEAAQWDDDVVESQGQLNEDGALDMSDIRVAQNDSEEEANEGSPFKNMQQAFD